MKKFLSVMLLAFCLSFAINFAVGSRAHAELNYVFSYNGIDYYIEHTDYTKMYTKQYATVFVCYRGSQKVIGDFAGILLDYQEYNGKWACNIFMSNGYNITIYDINNAQQYSNIVWSVYDFYQKKLKVFIARYEQYQREKAREEEEKRRAEQEENRRTEQEKINEFNAIISEADKFYANKDYLSAFGAYKAAGEIIFTHKETKPDGNVTLTTGGKFFRGSDKIEEFFNNLVKNGNDLYEQKNYSAALDYYKKAMVMKPDQDFLLKRIQIIYENIGNNNYEDINFHKLIYMMTYTYTGNPLYKGSKLSSEYVWDYYLKTKNFEEAVTFYDFLTTTYTNADLLYKLCHSLNEVGRYNEALKQLQKRDFTDKNTYYMYGKTYENLGDNKKAIEYYKKALKIDKNYTEAKEALGKLSSKN